MADSPRGYQNNNPGNIRRGHETAGLPGQRLLQTDSDYLQFDTSIDGIRALALLLRGYKTRGITRLEDILKDWSAHSAPAPTGYAAQVAAVLEKPRATPVDLDDRAGLRALVKAVIRLELGGDYYDDDEIAAGVDLAFDPQL